MVNQTAFLIPQLVQMFLHGDPANAWPGKFAKHDPDPNGHSEAVNCRCALQHLVDTCYDLPSDDPRATRRGVMASSRHLADVAPQQIRPSDMRQVQARLVKLGRARGYINRCHQRIVRFFEWCVAMEYMDPDVLRGIESVDLIPAGERGVHEPDRIESVADPVLERTTACASWLLRQAMAVHELGGMRPAELVAMRPCDICVVHHHGEVLWEYRPERFKTKRHRGSRIIPLPLEAQEILRKVVEYMYGQEGVLPGMEAAAVGRGVPKLGDGSDTRRIWWRAVGPTGRAEGWRNARSYGKAIQRARERAGVHMTANQLRKRRGTLAFDVAGEATAQSVLGHVKGSKITAKHYIDPASIEAREAQAARQFALDYDWRPRPSDEVTRDG